MIDEIETDFECRCAMRDRRSRQAARSHVKGDVPGVVRPRTQRQANFPHDLGPHVQRRRGVFPLVEWQSRPGIGRPVHDVGRRVGRLALSKGEGEGEGEGLRFMRFGASKPLTLILSPPARGEVTEARALSVSISNYMSRYSRLMKSENDRFTLSNIPRASSCALLKPCLIDRFALLMTPVTSP